MLEQPESQPIGPQTGATNSGGGAPAAAKKTTAVPATFDMSRSFEGAPKFIPMRAAQSPNPAAPVIAAPPKSATAVPLPPSPMQFAQARLNELLARAEIAVPRLESRLADEHAAIDRATRLTADIEERLRLGVRMLQAFDVQGERGDKIASRALAAIEQAEKIFKGSLEESSAHLEREAARITAERLEQIEMDLDAQRERLRQAECAAEEVANERLARIMQELDSQLARLKRADIDAAALSDERLETLRALCEAQLDRVARASAEGAKNLEDASSGARSELDGAMSRIRSDLEAQFARLERAERAERDAEAATAERVERLTGRIDAEIARLNEAEADAKQRGTQLLERITAELDSRANRAGEAAEARLRLLEESTKRIADEQIARVDAELAWRFDRVKEIEARIEQASNTALAAVDAELGARLAQLDELIGRTDAASARIEDALCQSGNAAAIIERSERTTAALAGLGAESQRLIESLAIRVGDASALRDVLGRLVHELAAAREVVQGEMRRMRDDLGWLVEKGERLSVELIDRSDRAVATSDSIRSVTETAAPLLAELTNWTPILAAPPRETLRPLTSAIAEGVREELSGDMEGFASALRQLAVRADGAFKCVSIETGLLHAERVGPAQTLEGAFEVASAGDGTRASSAYAQSGRDLARSFANEIARLGPISTFSSEGPDVLISPRAVSRVAAKPPAVAVNKPVDLEAS